MSSDDASCSDCRMELIERRWKLTLVTWINRCVNPKTKMTHLDFQTLVEVMNKYKEDICSDEMDVALFSIEDIELFIKFKYPMLRLRYLSEPKDYSRKLYILTSILLFYCCTSSQTGAVETDICTQLDKDDQELIIKFCENLCEMETTINNVECAIKGAHDHVVKGLHSHNPRVTSPPSFNEKNVDIELISREPTPKTIAEKKQTHHSVKSPKLKFKSSVTVMPSGVSLSSMSKSESSDERISYRTEINDVFDDNIAIYSMKHIDADDVKNEVEIEQQDLSDQNRCQPGCVCMKCSATGHSCGDVGSSIEPYRNAQHPEGSECCPADQKGRRECFRIPLVWYTVFFVAGLTMIVSLVMVLIFFPFSINNKEPSSQTLRRSNPEDISLHTTHKWECKKRFCQKVYHQSDSGTQFSSLSRCKLLCMGPQLWPYPIGLTQFSKKIVAIATNKLEYKLQSIPSASVQQYLGEALKLFIADLAKLEKVDTKHNDTGLIVKQMNIIIDVDSDPDPRVRYNTDESYTVNVETIANKVVMKVSAASFCGVRHGLETLSQMILIDQSSGLLITLSKSLIKDSPSYRYRGLMIDTARNFIPLTDLMRTIDAMSTVKLNTFHWRISDSTSFPFYLPEIPQLFQHGAYDKSMVYTKNDVIALVKRAGIRGLRVLIEVAVPGPVGRAWSWNPSASCPKRDPNGTCENVLCTRLEMQDSMFDTLQKIYSQIIELTEVDDVFHLSDGLFSLSNCYNLLDDREGFLIKSLERLKLANNGFLPKLPIIWYTKHLTSEIEEIAWDNLGVQLHDVTTDPGDRILSRFRVVHSGKWDLSCQMQKHRCVKYRTWQEMYGWKSWRNIEVLTVEGGEAILWTDLVDSGNLDYHLWPRVCAVAERLWSDISANSSANSHTYARLDAHRWRLLVRGVKVQPVWPVYCNFDPFSCISKLKK